MHVRREVQELADAGPFPAEDQATDEELRTIQQRLERVPRPVTDDEAQVLSSLFGPDDCHGLGWSLLHLIETAPCVPTGRRPVDPENPWALLLADRAKNSHTD